MRNALTYHKKTAAQNSGFHPANLTSAFQKRVKSSPRFMLICLCPPTFSREDLCRSNFARNVSVPFWQSRKFARIVPRLTVGIRNLGRTSAVFWRWSPRRFYFYFFGCSCFSFFFSAESGITKSSAIRSTIRAASAFRVTLFPIIANAKISPFAACA